MTRRLNAKRRERESHNTLYDAGRKAWPGWNARYTLVWIECFEKEVFAYYFHILLAHQLDGFSWPSVPLSQMAMSLLKYLCTRIIDEKWEEPSVCALLIWISCLLFSIPFLVHWFAKLNNQSEWFLSPTDFTSDSAFSIGRKSRLANWRWWCRTNCTN